MVLGFLPAISAQPGCNPAPEAPMGPILEAPGLWSLGMRGTNCLLSLPWSSLLSEWCCLPSPRLWGLFVCLHLCFYIYTYIYKSAWPSPHAQPALQLIYRMFKAAALLPASASAVSLIKCGGLSPPRLLRDSVSLYASLASFSIHNPEVARWAGRGNPRCSYEAVCLPFTQNVASPLGGDLGVCERGPA